MANLGCEALRSQDGESFLYFAYGSNLLTERIHLRNPSAVFYSVARVQVSALRLAPEMSSALSADKGGRILRTYFLRAACRQHWSGNAALSAQSTSGFPARPFPHGSLSPSLSPLLDPGCAVLLWLLCLPGCPELALLTFPPAANSAQLPMPLPWPLT